MGGSTEYIFGVYHTVGTPLKIWATALSWGLFGPSCSTYMFLKKAILSRLNKHYFEMYHNRWKIFGKFIDQLGENLDFRFNYTPKCMVSSMNFQNFSGEGLGSSDPLPALNLRLRRRFSGALRPRFGLRPQFTPPTCLITPLSTEGY